MAIIPINPYGTSGETSGLTTMRAKAIKMERGGLKNTGAMDYTIASYNGYIRSSMLIRTNDATKVSGKTLTGFTVYEYNQSFALVTTSSEGATFNSSTRYIKIAKQSSALLEEAVLMFDGDVEEVYNVQIESGTSSGHLLSETLVFGVGENVCTTARLILPSGYSISGKKVPLIIWCACDGSYPNWDFAIDVVGSDPAVITTQLQYLTSEGFAVLNVFPWGSDNFTNFPDCGQSGAVPVPVTLRAYEKAVSYVTTRFNISDTDIFMTSWSGSGKLSSYYAIHHPTFNLRSIYAFSPVVDGAVWRVSGENLGGGTGYRGAVNSEMHFVGSQTEITNYLSRWGGTYNTQAEIDFVKANAEKFDKFLSINRQNLIGGSDYSVDDKIADAASFGSTWYTEAQKASPNWSGLRGTIYNRYDCAITSDGAPITIIGAEDDAGCPYLAMEEFVAMLRNGGAEARIIALPNNSSTDYGDGHGANLGHRAPVFYNKMVNGTIPYGWWYAVMDIKARFLKNV